MGGVRARRKRRHGRSSLVDSQNAKIRKLYPPMRGIIALFQSLFSGRNLLKADAQCGVGFFHIMNWSRLSEQKFRVDKWSLCRG